MHYRLTLLILLVLSGISCAEESGTPFEFSMSSARKSRNRETPNTDFYGERSPLKAYPHTVTEEKEEPKQGRHGWKRVDPYAEDE